MFGDAQLLVIVAARPVLLLLTPWHHHQLFMEDSTRVDLQQLKARLAKLGVHIDEPVRLSGTVLGHPELQLHASSLLLLCALCRSRLSLAGSHWLSQMWTGKHHQQS